MTSRSVNKNFGNVWFIMGKRAIKRRIQSLLDRIHEHEQKILAEKQKTHPDEGLIAHWEKEIEAFKANIARAEKRLQL